jgi:medium-chain acyl-[acyl-carrier-protein] hydrolase
MQIQALKGKMEKMAATVKPVWVEEIHIKPSETDFQQKWKPAYILQALLEAAGSHANYHGFGFYGMLDQDIAWVLSRLKIRFYDFPTMDDPVHIQTWLKGIQQKIFFMRDFNLTRPDGQPVAVASYAWVVINLKTRRLLPPQSLGMSFPYVLDRVALDEPLEKLSVPDGLPEKMTVEASYSAVDVLGHVTSTRYVEWICDCFSLDEYRRRLDWLQVNYINEIKPGERLSICAGQDPANPSTWLVQGTNLNSGLRAFEAALGWKV